MTARLFGSALLWGVGTAAIWLILITLYRLIGSDDLAPNSKDFAVHVPSMLIVGFLVRVNSEKRRQ